MREFDGCGKSTLAKKLCNTYKAKYLHVSKPKTDNPFLEYVKFLARLNKNENYVIDRCFHGERAYGPVFRNKDGLDDLKQLALEVIASEHVAIVIYCWQGNNEIASAFISRGEKFTKLEHIPKLKKLYEETMKKCILPVLKYRWSTTSYSKVREYVESN